MMPERRSGGQKVGIEQSGPGPNRACDRAIVVPALRHAVGSVTPGGNPP